MMIEAVPFFHILINVFESEIGDDVGDTFGRTKADAVLSASRDRSHNHGRNCFQFRFDRYAEWMSSTWIS